MEHEQHVPRGLANAVAKLHWIASGQSTEQLDRQEARALLDKMHEGVTGKGTKDYKVPYGE